MESENIIPMTPQMNGPVGIEQGNAQAVTRAASLQRRRYRLNRNMTLHRNRRFQYVMRRGKSSGCTQFTMIYLQGRQLRVGITVSRKVGCAVVRNRIKRLLRENFRLIQHDISCGQYVFIARAPAADADYYTIGKSLRYIMRREGLLLKEI